MLKAGVELKSKSTIIETTKLRYLIIEIIRILHYLIRIRKFKITK